MASKEAGQQKKRDKGLMAIAIFKWSKALVLILAGLGCLKMLHQDAASLVQNLLDQLRVDPDNRYLAAMLAKLNLLDDKKVEALSALSFAYSALFLVEGTGLFFEKRWAEFLTIFATASFVPLEIYELIKGASLLKAMILILNIAILFVLLIKVFASKRSSEGHTR